MINPTQFFKCLSDETRLQAVLMIHHERELCVCELVEALQVSQPKISRHLAQLRNCGVLDDDRRGQWVFYSISKKLPSWALNILDEASLGSQQSLNPLKINLQAMKNRPECC